MKRYLVELYAPRRQASDFEEEAERIRSVTEDLHCRGRQIRYLRSLFLPEDETCFHLFEAAGMKAVEETIRNAGLEYERISPALDSESDSHA